MQRKIVNTTAEERIDHFSPVVYEMLLWERLETLAEREFKKKKVYQTLIPSV
jgi:hypothetical protein